MKHIVPVLLLASLLGCDQPQDSCPSSDGLRIAVPEGADPSPFREKPFASYISGWDGSAIITHEEFVEAVLICADQEKKLVWLLTLSAYTPENSTNNEQVVGLGGGAISEGPWIDCMMGVWEKYGGIQF